MPTIPFVQAGLFVTAAILLPVAWRMRMMQDGPAGRWAKRFFWISSAAFAVALARL